SVPPNLKGVSPSNCPHPSGSLPALPLTPPASAPTAQLPSPTLLSHSNAQFVTRAPRPTACSFSASAPAAAAAPPTCVPKTSSLPASPKTGKHRGCVVLPRAASTQPQKRLSQPFFEFRYSNLFRASIFEFRTSAHAPVFRSAFGEGGARFTLHAQRS